MKLQSGVVLRSRGWLAALLLLGVNDHLLKGSGLLPGLVTGKLSDFAGLFIAPTLLALLLRARGRVALLGCHVAVGLVFSGIQLSEPFAASFGWAMGLLGLPWATTSDPTDLIALVAVVASYRRFAPTLELPMQPTLLPMVRRGVLAVSLLLCLATSYEGPRGGFYGRGVHLHNASGGTLEVQLRGIRDSVRVDCDALGGEPGSLIPESAFGLATRYTLGPGQNLPVEDHKHSGGCSAILVSGGGLTPAMLFFDHQHLFGSAPAGYGADEPRESGAVAIEFNASGQHTGYATLAQDGALVFEHSPGSGELAPPCRPAEPGSRLAWSSGLSSGSYRLEEVEVSPDGCFALELSDPVGDASDVDGGVADAGDGVANTTVTEHVCPGLDGLPFGAGDVIDVSTVGGLTLSGAGATLRIVRAGDLLGDTFSGALPDGQRLSLAFHPREQCDFFVQEDCARVGRTGYLELSTTGAVAIVEPGQGPTTVGDKGQAVAPLVEELVLVDTECAGDGRDGLGADFDLGVVLRRVGS